MPEIAAKPDQNELPPSNLHKFVRRVIKSFFLSAFVVAVLCAGNPDIAVSTFKKLGSFTLSTMAGLLGDALLGCEADVAAAPQTGAPKVETRKRCTASSSDPDACRRAELLNHGDEGKRQCVDPLIPGWPVTGQWQPRLEARGVRIPLVGVLIAVADVAGHLVVPTEVEPETSQRIVGFVGLLQLILGFGITTMLLKPIARRLNDVWLLLILAVGTLLIGASATWLLLWVIGAALAEMSSLVGPWGSVIVAISATYAAAAAIIKFLLEDTVHHGVEEVADLLADKVAAWFVRFAP